MGSKARGPSGVVRRLVAWAVGDGRADDVIGDLEELAGRRTGLRRTAFYWGRALGLALRSVGRNRSGAGLHRSGGREGGWLQDIRFAVRSYRRTPVLASAMLVTLALGIGANTAIFSVVDAVMLRPLPFPEPERLVLLWEQEPHEGRLEPFSPPNLQDARDGVTGLEGLAGWVYERYSMTGTEEPEQILTVRVTEDFFDVLGAAPALGRAFRAADEADVRTAVLSHGFWTRRFGADPAVLGRIVILDYHPYEVVGIMPPTFAFPDDPEVAAWIPLVRYRWEQIRHTRNTRAIGRLAQGATLERVQQEASAVAVRMAETHPQTNEGYGMVVQRAEVLSGDNRTLLILLGAVTLVLLIACANVANLLLARARERGRELAVRRSLGASRWRVARQLLAESGVIAVAGALLGGGLAWVGVPLLLALEPGALPGWNDVGLNGTVLAFVGAVSLFVTFAAGLGPALKASRQDVVGGLHHRGARDGGVREGLRTRATLSVVEIALAVILLAGAGLLVSSLSRLVRVDPGFQPDGLMTATIELPDTRYDYGTGDMERVFQSILEGTRDLPMVTAAGWVTTLPMNPVGSDYDIEFYSVEHPERTPVDAPVQADFRVLSAGYFEAMRIPLIRGRTFSDADREDSAPVVLVNQSLADRFFAGENPLGQHIRLYQPGGTAYEVVGVVGDVKHRGLDDQARPELYVPYRQMTHGEMSLAIRYEGDLGTAVEGLRRVVAGVDSDLPLIAVRRVGDLLDETVAERRFYMTLLLSFAGLGLVLAVVGVYGTLAHSVSRRRQEIGVRMAVGAGSREVVWLVVGQGLRLVAVGLLLGLGGAAVLTRGLRSLLYEVEPGDPVTFASVVGVVTMVALVACWLPAHRASKLEPTSALREG